MRATRNTGSVRTQMLPLEDVNVSLHRRRLELTADKKPGTITVRWRFGTMNRR